MSKTCITCGARCCRYFCFQIDQPTSFEEFENVRWFLAHEGITVHIDMEGDWYIAIANRCLHLDEKNRCNSYANRPLICRSYNLGGCDFTQGDYEYVALFKTSAQLEQYARMKLGPARYDKIRNAARLRAEKKAQAAIKQAKREQERDKRKASGGNGNGKANAKRNSRKLPSVLDLSSLLPAARRSNGKKRKEKTLSLSNLFV